MIPVAFLVFWFPLEPNMLMPYFSPAYLFTNSAGLSFCMMTPVYIAILTLYYSRVNIATLRITSLVGIIIDFYNMLNFLNPTGLWLGALHIPLLTISMYGLILSLRKKPLEETRRD